LDDIARMRNLRKLRVYGESPFCGPDVRCVLPKIFEDQVDVS